MEEVKDKVLIIQELKAEVFDLISVQEELQRQYRQIEQTKQEKLKRLQEFMVEIKVKS